jgi:hypothetical protein
LRIPKSLDLILSKALDPVKCTLRTPPAYGRHLRPALLISLYRETLPAHCRLLTGPGHGRKRVIKVGYEISVVLDTNR